MVYLHFPSNLTEEELMLQAKYQKLKKKKKALQALKAPKPEPEKPVLPKRAAEARDAREIARKLFKSGMIPAIKTPPPLPQNATFKRPRAGRERKLSGAGVGAGGAVAAYQPFGAPHELAHALALEPAVPRTPPPVPTPAPPRTEAQQQRVKNLYDSFVVSTIKEEKPEPQKTKSFNTVFVSAQTLSEEFVKKMMTPFGTIVNICIEHEKNKGFVTFEKATSAAHAAAELDGIPTPVTGNGIGGPLRVSPARRQPQVDKINDSTCSSAWSSLATQNSTKGSGGKALPRQLVTYDDNIFES